AAWSTTRARSDAETVGRREPPRGGGQHAIAKLRPWARLGAKAIARLRPRERFVARGHRVARLGAKKAPPGWAALSFFITAKTAKTAKTARGSHVGRGVRPQDAVAALDTGTALLEDRFADEAVRAVAGGRVGPLR